jgi:hypothetical protein
VAVGSVVGVSVAGRGVSVGGVVAVNVGGTVGVTVGVGAGVGLQATREATRINNRRERERSFIRNSFPKCKGILSHPRDLCQVPLLILENIAIIM